MAPSMKGAEVPPLLWADARASFGRVAHVEGPIRPAACVEGLPALDAAMRLMARSRAKRGRTPIGRITARHFEPGLNGLDVTRPLRMSSPTVAIVLASKNSRNYPDEQPHDAGERHDRSRGPLTRNRAGQTESR